MKKITASVLIMFLLLFFAFEILTESKSILESVTYSFNIWKDNIFPSLFPFFVLSEILINYGFVEFIGELLKPFMQKVFKIDGNSAFIFVMSIISGFPSNSKYTKELYKNNIINLKTANKILMFSHFSNPLFILGTVSVLFLNNKEAGLLILICHYLGNFIIGLLFRNYNRFDSDNNSISLKKAIIKMHNKRINNNLRLGQIITNSILNSINTLLMILGVVTMFLVITTVINNNVNLDEYYISILNGSIEMTQGLKYVSIANIPLKIKCIISVAILSFGGFSVHMQIINILSDTDIKYLPFLTARLIHSLISSLLTLFLFDFWISFF
ncbi:MAG TPA: hypothetical protein GX747_01835 [Tenericutes bacterium]|nr:hypothetical protein [Mycoplasmatota bacterium]